MELNTVERATKTEIRQKNRIKKKKKEWASSVGLYQILTVTSPPRKCEPRGDLLEVVHDLHTPYNVDLW